MANSKKQDYKDLEALIKETDEKHSRAIQEIREETQKSLDEIKFLIAGIVSQAPQVPSHVHSHVDNRGDGILGPGDNSRNGSNIMNSNHYAKLEFPRFDGFGLHEWLYKVDQFFEIDHTSEINKVKMASIHLDGKALNWFKAFLNTKEREGVISWFEFVNAITARFGEQMFLDPVSELKKLKQTGSLQQYLDDFDMKLSRCDLNETQAISHFLGGLREEIELSVRLFKPVSLQSAYALAKVQELLWLRKGKSESVNFRNDSYGSFSNRSVVRSFVDTVNPSSTVKTGNVGLPNSDNSSKNLTKKLSSEEIDERRKKGLCFWCEEKFIPGHKCKRKQVFMLSVEEIEDDEEEGTRKTNGIEQTENSTVPELSSHAVSGTYNFQTMRIRGSVGTKILFILIDSGSTHNFLSSRMAKQLGCKLEPIPELKVSTANGSMLTCNEKCKEFSWSMQGYKFMAEFLVLPLDNYDMVLGIQWLSELDDITWNFKKLQMKFQFADQTYSLRGETDKSLQWISEEKMKKLLAKESQLALNQCFTFTLMNSEDSSVSGHNELSNRLQSVQEEVAGILLKIAEAFQVQRGLVLVKRRDNSWIMCIDYNSLNHMAVKNKFPILVIEELLDELHGATIFSKLALKAGYHQIRMHPKDILVYSLDLKQQLNGLYIGKIQHLQMQHGSLLMIYRTDFQVFLEDKETQQGSIVM